MQEIKNVPANTHTDVLREMVRLAEARRTEELQMMERVNHYNLALIAFSGSFLSLLVTAHFANVVVIIAGCILLISIGLSIFTVYSAILLACALLATYTLDTYAKYWCHYNGNLRNTSTEGFLLCQ